MLHGNIPNLRAALDDAIGRGCSGIISFGIAGGLAPDLKPGAWVVASGVVAAHRRYHCGVLGSHAALRHARDCEGLSGGAGTISV